MRGAEAAERSLTHVAARAHVHTRKPVLAMAERTKRSKVWLHFAIIDAD